MVLCTMNPKVLRALDKNDGRFIEKWTFWESPDVLLSLTGHFQISCVALNARGDFFHAHPLSRYTRPPLILRSLLCSLKSFIASYSCALFCMVSMYLCEFYETDLRKVLFCSTLSVIYENFHTWMNLHFLS